MKHIILSIALAICIASCEKKHESNGSHEEHAKSDSSMHHRMVNKDSCENGIYIEHAHAYNNFIIDNQAYIVEKNINFVKTLESGENNDKTAEYYKALTEQTKNSIDSLEKLCPFNGNTSYKDAGIELFKFYATAWSEYKSLIDIKSKEERIKNYKAVKAVFHDKYSETERTLEEKFHNEHVKFANEYELHIRRTPLHEKLDSMLYLKK